MEKIALNHCLKRLVSSNVDKSLKLYLLFCGLDGYSHLHEVKARCCLAGHGVFSIPWTWVRECLTSAQELGLWLSKK